MVGFKGPPRGKPPFWGVRSPTLQKTRHAELFLLELLGWTIAVGFDLCGSTFVPGGETPGVRLLACRFPSPGQSSRIHVSIWARAICNFDPLDSTDRSSRLRTKLGHLQEMLNGSLFVEGTLFGLVCIQGEQSHCWGADSYF